MIFKKVDEELYDHIVWILSKGCEGYQHKYNNDFRKVLDACLDEYLRLVREATLDMLFYAKVVYNCGYMNRIVKSYMQGRHSTAFMQLKNVLKINSELYITEVPAGEFFYRMRNFGKRKGLSRKDIFHIPLNMIRDIKTQRYSAPGYPCLYLGKSIYGCWEELYRPSTETTFVSCFKTQDALSVLDLRVPTLTEFFENTERYMQLFPLIIACGIPVRNRDDIYKPEYIIPQLILESIIDSNAFKESRLAGVYYTSTNRNEDFYLLDHEWDNLAIPVQKGLNDEVFCPILKKLFYCTRPTCYEYELIQGNINTANVMYDEQSSTRTDDYKTDYYMSVFARMETILGKRSFYEVDTMEVD
ncbi:MAG: RES domain-containing protein [Bacteroidales bacterium]|nr:RES domain-containing protein [Bacteroidales bacterium]